MLRPVAQYGNEPAQPASPRRAINGSLVYIQTYLDHGRFTGHR